MPDNLNEQITILAKTNFRNREVPFGIKSDDRRRHMYVIGKTGMGKTTLMENMVIQDIHNGHGVAFLDPHGDSVQRILDCVPNSRINDVVYFNPADLEYPVAFNILEAVEAKYKHLVASGLMGVFTKIWANLWSARMEYILNNTILALLDSPGNTLLGITRMYVDKKYRKKIVDNIKDPMVRAFWTDEFANYNEKYRTEAIAPIQNKVGQFLSSGIIRNIVGQPKSTIDLREIMDNRKILIMDLSKGKVGEDNSALLGAMVVTKLQLAALSRADIPEHDRKDFYLYVDEFQNFATESFATILSEARKYRLNLTVGHQYIAQLEQDRNTKVRDAIFGNVGTIIVFRVGAADAEFMETEFDPIFTPNDLVNLPKHSIILKLMINGVASEPFTANTLAPNPDYVTDNGQKVIKVSRERYSNPVSEVEEKISRWMGAEFHQETAVLVTDQDNGADKELSPEKIPQNRPAPRETVIQKPAEFIIRPPVEPMTEVEPQAQRPEAQNIPVPAPPRAPLPEPVRQQREPEQRILSPIRKVEPTRPQQPRERNYNERGEGSRHKEEYGANRSHNNHNNRNNSHSTHSGFGNSGRDRGHGQPLHKPKKPAPKKHNPIWDTVANLHKEKTEQEQKKVAEVVEHLIDEKQNRPERPSLPKIEAAKPASQQASNPTRDNSNERKVLKPGQAQKVERNS